MTLLEALRHQVTLFICFGTEGHIVLVMLVDLVLVLEGQIRWEAKKSSGEIPDVVYGLHEILVSALAPVHESVNDTILFMMHSMHPKAVRYSLGGDTRVPLAPGGWLSLLGEVEVSGIR